MRVIIGEEAEKLLNEQIDSHHRGILQALAPLDVNTAVDAWLDNIRAVEEFINLPLFGLDDETGENFCSIRLDTGNEAALIKVKNILQNKFDHGVVKRFIRTMRQASAMCQAFRQHNMLEAAVGLSTIGHAIGYFQSRRRHLVTLLYTLPIACRGNQKVDRLDAMNLFLPQVEYSAIALTGLFQKLMLAKVFPDFEIHIHKHGFTTNHHYETLDHLFLEPERANIMEMSLSDEDKTLLQSLEALDERLVFSAAELRNNIILIEAAYSEFDLGGTEFASVARLVRDCLDSCEDEYLIKISAERFSEHVRNAGLTESIKERVVHRSGTYVDNSNAFAPFINLGDTLLSTVTLLSRFMYYWKTVCLNRLRRFQIRSGFILEGSVKDALRVQGFTVSEIKRINHKEFDVIAVLEGVIYNVQCKNNLVDLSRIENDAIRFARYNRQLDRYYSKALVKEELREHLLKDKLGLEKVQHIVVSRFPVATANPRIVSYNRINDFRNIVTSQTSRAYA